MQMTGTIAACWVDFANVVLVFRRDPQKNARWPTVKCTAGNWPQAATGSWTMSQLVFQVDQLQRATERQGQLRANKKPVLTSFSAHCEAPGA